MIILIILGYVVVGAVELFLWQERRWQEVVVYVVLLSAAALLSALLTIDPNLPVPEPLGALSSWLQKFRQ